MSTTGAGNYVPCPHCGMAHSGVCPRVRAIEYHQDGVTVKRVEFHSPYLVALPTADYPVGIVGPGYVIPRTS